jgi:hypothetical protein
MTGYTGSLLSRAIFLSVFLQEIFAHFVLLTDRASPISTVTCDFALPPLSFHASLSHSVNFPPLSLATKASRYSWACQASKDLINGSVFKVDAHANVDVSGMLLVAAENSGDRATAGYNLNVEVIMTDPLDTSSDSEWIIKSDAMLSYSTKSIQSVQSVQPTLWLRFVTRSCGCVMRLRFVWTRKGGMQESCELPVKSQESSEHGACAPFWAYSKYEPTGFLKASHSTPSAVDLPSSNPCHPVVWSNIPPPQRALVASFNGDCRYDFLVSEKLY